MNGTLEHVVRRSFLYSYMLSQPFAVYVDAYPILQNKLLIEADQMAYGEHHEMVRVLQKKLNRLSYYDDELDGKFGVLTEHALKEFQKDYDMEVTGVADDKTTAMLIEVEREMHMERLESFSESVYPGEHGEHVKIVQEALQFYGYYEGEIDGIYGPLTEKALFIAEENHQISLSEEITKEALLDMHEKEKQEEADLKHINQLKKYAPTAYMGMTGETVVIIQESLRYFGYYHGNIDGIYGPLTKDGLQQAEQEHGLDLVIEPVVDEAQHEEKELEPLSNASTSPPAAPVEPVEEDHSEQNDGQQTETSEPKQVPVESFDPNIIETARGLIGTPYVWGGTSPSGFDCSGFIQYVYQQQNKTIPRTVSDMWNFATPVSEPSVGDLVFFETYKAGPSHLGIYLGNGQFIHAGESRGVEISNLDQSYWKTRYLGAKRIE